MYKKFLRGESEGDLKQEGKWRDEVKRRGGKGDIDGVFIEKGVVDDGCGKSDDW